MGTRPLWERSFSRKMRAIGTYEMHYPLEAQIYRQNDLNRTGRPTSPTSHAKLSGIQSRYDLNRTSRPSFVFLQTFLFSSQLPRGVAVGTPPPWVVGFERDLAPKKPSWCNKLANWGYLSRLVSLQSGAPERAGCMVVASRTKKFAEKQMNGREVRFSSYRLTKL